MNPTIADVLGTIVALTCTILSLILITPKSKREGLNKFFQFIHDLFNFKFLIIEKILKALYIFSTLFCIATGFFLLFSGYSYGRYSEYFGGYGSYQSLAPAGLILMFFGPIIMRLFYE